MLAKPNNMPDSVQSTIVIPGLFAYLESVAVSCHDRISFLVVEEVRRRKCRGFLMGEYALLKNSSILGDFPVFQ